MEPHTDICKTTRRGLFVHVMAQVSLYQSKVFLRSWKSYFPYRHSKKRRQCVPQKSSQLPFRVAKTFL